MANETDGNTGGGWRLAGNVRYAREERRWIVSHETEDDEGVTLHVVVQHPNADELIRLYEVRLPLRVDRDDLIVGEPEAREA